MKFEPQVIYLLLIGTITGIMGNGCTRQANESLTITAIPVDMATSCQAMTLSPHNITILIGDAASQPLVSLEMLEISDGPLVAIQENALEGMVLQELVLSKNLFEHLPDLSDLNGSLEKLDLSVNSIESVEQQLSAMTHLWKLDLSRNSIHSVDPGSFCGTGLIKLYLSNNNIQNVPNLECVGDTLTWLELNDNQILSLTGAFTGLHHLETLRIKGNLLTVIESYQFSSLPAMTTLALSENPITSISTGAFCNTSLSHLYLKNMDLTQFPDLACIAESLEAIDVRDQLITDFTYAVQIPNLHIVSLHIAQVPDRDVITLLSYAVTVNLACFSTLPITEIDVSFLQGATRLNSLLIRNCGLVSFPDFSVISEAASIIQLDLSSNDITYIPANALVPLSSLRILSVAYNNLMTIDQSAFNAQSFDVIESLIFKHNDNFNPEPGFFTLFTALTNVELDSTSLSHFPDFSGSLSTLETLDLHNTRLDRFNAEIFLSMPNLENLDLSGSLNSLQTLPNLTDAILSNSLTSLDISDNDIACGCYATWTLEFQDTVTMDNVLCTVPYVVGGRSLLELTVSSLCPGVVATLATVNDVNDCIAHCTAHAQYECSSVSYDVSNGECTMHHDDWRMESLRDVTTQQYFFKKRDDSPYISVSY